MYPDPLVLASCALVCVLILVLFSNSISRLHCQSRFDSCKATQYKSDVFPPLPLTLFCSLADPSQNDETTPAVQTSSGIDILRTNFLRLPPSIFTIYLLSVPATPYEYSALLEPTYISTLPSHPKLPPKSQILQTSQVTHFSQLQPESTSSCFPVPTTIEVAVAAPTRATAAVQIASCSTCPTSVQAAHHLLHQDTLP